jgi:hypothetical protein
MAVYYLSQADIARELEVSNEAVRGWRKRYPAGKAHPFPEPDAWTGVDEVAEEGKAPPPRDAGDNPRDNSRSVPGWLETRLDEIKAWRAGMPGQAWRAGVTGPGSRTGPT